MGYDDPERSGHIEWAKLTPADYPMNKREHFTVANAASNPSRQTVWAGPYFEPVYNQLLVSALTPVYVGDVQIATIGSDDLLGDLEARILQSDIPGASHTVFRKDGRLVVDPQYMQRIVASPNGFSIAESGDVRLEALRQLAMPAGNAPVYGYAKNIDQYYSIGLLSSTGWYFASTLPGQMIRGQAFRAVQWVLWVGIAFGRPVDCESRPDSAPTDCPAAACTSGRHSWCGGGRERALPAGADDELGHMAAAFNTMLGKVSERDAALRNEKERFRALIEHAADVIVVVAADGGVGYVSPAAQAALGRGAETFLGRSLLSEAHPEDQGRLAAALQAVVGHPGEIVERTEFRIRHADGTWRWLETTGTNQIGNPAVNGIVINARDVGRQGCRDGNCQAARESPPAREARGDGIAACRRGT